MSGRIVKALRREIREWVEHLFIRNLPGRIGLFIRGLYWSKQFRGYGSLLLSQGCVLTNPGSIDIGGNVNIMHNCCLYAHSDGRIVIGDRVTINSNVQIGAAEQGEIVIGNDVAIGPNVVLRASNHRYKRKDVPINEQGHAGGKIIIEYDVWIGANAVILPNVVIGRGSVVGAGAVVNKSIPPYSLAGGVPAKVIKENCRS